MRNSVIKEAADLIHGKRADEYDNERDSELYPAIRQTAELWTEYFGYTVTPSDVCLLMALHKKARYTISPDHRDSRVDEIAYLSMAHDLELELYNG